MQYNILVLKMVFVDKFRISMKVRMKIQQIFSKIIKELQKIKITFYSANNAAVNYGVQNSVFQKQKRKNENNKIIKANSKYNVIKNCVKSALNALSVEVENIVIKTFILL